MGISFDYTAADLVNPIGSNQLAAFALYYQRSLYEQEIYPATVEWPIDLYYQKQLYGKVDRKQNTIVTSAPHLMTIKDAVAPNMFALGPTAVAFEAFAAHMRKANIMGVAKDAGNPKLYDLKAAMAYSNPFHKYQAYLEGAYDVYRRTFTPAQNQKVLGFGSFAEDYKQYLLRVSKTYPVTKTNFLLTPSVSPFTSGLAIGIDKANCGDDHYKYVNYISDPNFEFYIRAAKKFGFLVDRNAPWILWSDLFSPAFSVNYKYFYYTQNNVERMVTRDNFFEAFYAPAWKSDIKELREAFVKAYSTLTQTHPYAEIFPPRLVAPGATEFIEGCTLKKIIKRRDPIDDHQVSTVLTDKFMIDFYVDLRQSEAQTTEVNPVEVKRYAYERYRNQLKQSLTKLENAVQYINSVYAPYVYTLQNLAVSFPASSTAP